jgi:hypothetical protein
MLTKILPRVLLAGAVAFALSSCGLLVAPPAQDSQVPALPQSGATSEDYLKVVDAAEQVILDAAEFIPESAIDRAAPTVQNLESDFHRMSCSDTTSQYVNNVNYYLVDGTDEIVIIDEIRATYEAEGWQRADSVAEQMGEEQDPEGLYPQTMLSPDDYGLSVSRGDDGQGGTILQLSVYSPCIGNPSDKPNTWGRG